MLFRSVLLDCYWKHKVRADDQDIYLQDGLLARFVKEGDEWSRKVAPVPTVSLVMRCGED